MMINPHIDDYQKQKTVFDQEKVNQKALKVGESNPSGG